MKLTDKRTKEIEREANREIVIKQADKWVPTIKRNREKEFIDYRNKDNSDAFRVNDKSIKNKSN